MTTRHLVFALCLFSIPALADDPAPWQKAAAIAAATDADIAKAGIHGIDAHVADLEQALAEGAVNFPPKPEADGRAVVLVDSPTESLLALTMAANKKQNTVTHPNPYAEIGLGLALYYNEMHRPQDTLRVIDATFKLKGMPGVFLGVRDAGLFTEQAGAYLSLKRWSDGLASADAALKASQTDRDKARSNRSRGLFLTELERLDDAEAAYQASLKLEPGNAVATRELAYIAKLRAGGPKAPTEILPGTPPKPPN